VINLWQLTYIPIANGKSWNFRIGWCMILDVKEGSCRPGGNICTLCTIEEPQQSISQAQNHSRHWRPLLSTIQKSEPFLNFRCTKKQVSSVNHQWWFQPISKWCGLEVELNIQLEWSWKIAKLIGTRRVIRWVSSLLRDASKVSVVSFQKFPAAKNCCCPPFEMFNHPVSARLFKPHQHPFHDTAATVRCWVPQTEIPMPANGSTSQNWWPSRIIWPIRVLLEGDESVADFWGNGWGETACQGDGEQNKPWQCQSTRVYHWRMWCRRKESHGLEHTIQNGQRLFSHSQKVMASATLIRKWNKTSCDSFDDMTTNDAINIFNYSNSQSLNMNYFKL